jgi:DNA-directed RNA polymerase specialized sigma24 family protein
MTETETAKIKRWTRVTGTDRAALTERVVALYLNREMSIREISEDTGRSYGAVHTLLKDAGVELRPRGNPRV